MTPAQRLAPAFLLAALLPFGWLPQPAVAQQFRSTVCSFWIKGNPIASRQCRVGRTPERVFTINYLADIPPGEVKAETVSAGKDNWQYGTKPECLVYAPTGYTICAQ
jgi:hypothetical protein